MYSKNLNFDKKLKKYMRIHSNPTKERVPSSEIDGKRFSKTNRRHTELTLKNIKSTGDILHGHKMSYFTDILHPSKKLETNQSMKSEEIQLSKRKLTG